MHPRRSIIALLLLLGFTLPGVNARAAEANEPATPTAAPSGTAAEPGPATASAAPSGTAAEPASARPQSFTAVATPDRVKLGETFVYVIEIHDASHVRYELPRDLSLGKEFDLVEVDAKRKPDGRNTVTRFSIKAAMFELGEKRLPDLTLDAVGPDGVRKLVIPGPPVTGLGSIADDQQAELRDIQPPVEVLVPNYTALYLLAGVLAAALLALLIVRWLRNRKPRVKAAPVAPPLPAHERALRALESLQREDLPSQGRSQEFYFRLSEIVRDYLGERFGFHALDMTTSELLAALSRLPTPGLDFASFEAFCHEGDLIKYARQPASASACKTAIEAAFGFVRSTMPQATPAARPSSSAGAA